MKNQTRKIEHVQPVYLILVKLAPDTPYTLPNSRSLAANDVKIKFSERELLRLGLVLYEGRVYFHASQQSLFLLNSRL